LWLFALVQEDSSEKLVGFRITFAAQSWEIDQWCSPELWQASMNKCCYFKYNTVDENYRGLGIGKNYYGYLSKQLKSKGHKQEFHIYGNKVLIIALLPISPSVVAN